MDTYTLNMHMLTIEILVCHLEKIVMNTSLFLFEAKQNMPIQIENLVDYTHTILKNPKPIKDWLLSSDEDTKHNFNVVIQTAEKVKELAGPVYLKENANHAFSELGKSIENVKALYVVVKTKAT